MSFVKQYKKYQPEEEHNFDISTQIGGWYMSKRICNDILKYWDYNKDKSSNGETSSYGKSQVIKSVKESNEIVIPFYKSNEPWNEYKEQLYKIIAKYRKKYPEMDDNVAFGLGEHYNLQNYPVGGGFKEWHFENDFSSKEINAHRCLVFMTYLNDVEDGGTEFKYQNIISPAKKGLTLIWPAYWTHTHRGVVSKTKEKTIVTGWLNYVDYIERK